MILMAALLAPTLIPLLPPETYIRYAEATASPAAAHRDCPTRAAPAIIRRPVRLAGNGRHRCARYQRSAARRPRQDRIFTQNYGQAGAIDLFGPRYGLPSHQRPPELLSLGTARLHRREHDRDGRPPGDAWRSFSREVQQGGPCGPPLLHALRAFRRVLLPRVEAPVSGVLAEREELALTFLRCAGARIHLPAGGRKI